MKQDPEQDRRDAETVGLTIVAAIAIGPLRAARPGVDDALAAESAYDLAEALFAEAKKRGRDPIALLVKAAD